jgi:hypothetical protein
MSGREILVGRSALAGAGVLLASGCVAAAGSAGAGFVRALGGVAVAGFVVALWVYSSWGAGAVLVLGVVVAGAVAVVEWWRSSDVTAGLARGARTLIGRGLRRSGTTGPVGGDPVEVDLRERGDRSRLTDVLDLRGAEGEDEGVGVAVGVGEGGDGLEVAGAPPGSTAVRPPATAP